MESWFEVTEKTNQILQGDILQNFPVFSPVIGKKLERKDLDGNNIDMETRNYEEIIILTQSCDLEQKKVKLITISPIAPLDKVIDQIWNSTKKLQNFPKDFLKEKVRNGEMNHLHLLNECSINSFERDYTVINFRNIYTVHINQINLFLDNKRLRLISPYREHLSQSFARFFMRVGLPSNIPPFFRPNNSQ